MADSDQYAIWADEVCAKLREGEGRITEQDFRDIVAAGLRGAAVEILKHADVLVENAALGEKSVMRREGVMGARAVLKTLLLGVQGVFPREQISS